MAGKRVVLAEPLTARHYIDAAIPIGAGAAGFLYLALVLMRRDPWESRVWYMVFPAIAWWGFFLLFPRGVRVVIFEDGLRVKNMRTRRFLKNGLRRKIHWGEIQGIELHKFGAQERYLGIRLKEGECYHQNITGKYGVADREIGNLIREQWARMGRELEVRQHRRDARAVTSVDGNVSP